MNNSRTSAIRSREADAIAEGGRVLARGGIVAFPTETVYGLGADATNGDALARLFALKARPRFNPLIVHVATRADAAKLAAFTPLANRLAERFWPGPLTLVLPRRADSAVSLLACAGLSTIAIRIPAHPIANSLIAAATVPVAAPSANPSGRLSATEAMHVAAELGDRIDLLIDGGRATIGLESTVIGFSDQRAILLRLGAVTRDEVETATGTLLDADAGVLSSPGRLTRHYMPRAQLRLEASAIREGEVFLAFGEVAVPGGVPSLNLSPAGDLREAAANLFSMLRRLDDFGSATIAVAPIPNQGLGEAINDRLARAAASMDGGA